MTGKAFRRGTHRAVDPAATLRRLQPAMRSLGVTRFSNLTGLDVIGIPVVGACRPNSRSNIVFQGKGLDLDAAKASAAMEAVETCCAERILDPVKLASAEEMRRGHALADVSRLPRILGSRFTDRTRLLWIEGRDLLAGGPAWLPYEMVHADFTLPYPPGAGCFPAGTNGLASGNNPPEALSHGICEVIERDAAALFAAAPRAMEARRLDLESIDDADCVAVLGKLAAARMAVAVWDITSDIGVAAFLCHVMEREDGPGLLPLPAEGHGCHPDRAIALLRALTEAVQARATVIAGTRDDIGPRMYGRFDDVADLARWREAILSRSWGCRFGEAPDFRCDTLEEDLSHVLRRLRQSGVAQVVAVDLTPAAQSPFAVVRIVIPGLEGPRHAGCTPGPRAQALADGWQ